MRPGKTHRLVDQMQEEGMYERMRTSISVWKCERGRKVYGKREKTATRTLENTPDTLLLIGSGRKAINMTDQPPIREREKTNWEFFLSLSEVDATDLNLAAIKNSQLLTPLFGVWRDTLYQAGNAIVWCSHDHVGLTEFGQFQHSPVLLLLFLDLEPRAKLRDRSAHGSASATCSEDSRFLPSSTRPKNA